MAGVAGSERYYLNLLPALVERGAEPAFLIVERVGDRPLNDAFADELHRAGVRVIRREYRAQISWTLIQRLAKVVRQGRYDIVQSNLLHADVWLAIAKRFLVPGMRLVSAKHGYAEDYQLRSGLDPAFVRTDRYALATRLAATQADRVIAISRGLADFHARAGLVDRNKIEIIPYGFTFANAISKLPSGRARSSTPQMISVGRLVPYKQHDILIRSVADLVPAHPGLKLVVVGAGPEEGRLKRLAESLGISDVVIWTGYVTNAHDYLRDSDVFVLPSASEGFGAVILEAWHNGLPVVAFDVPAPNEIITHGEDGFLVEPYDEVQLKQRISELLEDQNLRTKMGERGRHTYQHRYTIEAMTAETLAVYEDVLARDAKTSPTSRS
jgi:glycosyltransferase involved in cell wall biosynthesis